MSIADMNIDLTLAHIVEAMLPRFSDTKLGLLLRLQLEASDFGYAEDGNTLVREPQHIRRDLNFLFVRPSNYTKVFLFEPNDEEYSWFYQNKEHLWNLESDHDSCWRSDGLRRITDVYFEICEPICKAKSCAPKDVSTFNHLDRTPQYVELEIFEQADPTADRFSTEGRVWRIKMKDIGFDRLIQRTYEDKNFRDELQTFKTGLLIKDGELDKRFINGRGAK